MARWLEDACNTLNEAVDSARDRLPAMRDPIAGAARLRDALPDRRRLPDWRDARRIARSVAASAPRSLPSGQSWSKSWSKSWPALAGRSRTTGVSPGTATAIAAGAFMLGAATIAFLALRAARERRRRDEEWQEGEQEAFEHEVSGVAQEAADASAATLAPEQTR